MILILLRAMDPTCVVSCVKRGEAAMGERRQCYVAESRYSRRGHPPQASFWDAKKRPVAAQQRDGDQRTCTILWYTDCCYYIRNTAEHRCTHDGAAPEIYIASAARLARRSEGYACLTIHSDCAPRCASPCLAPTSPRAGRGSRWPAQQDSRAARASVRGS